MDRYFLASERRTIRIFMPVHQPHFVMRHIQGPKLICKFNSICVY
ncbi:hypothetical protein SAMN05216517_101184 [Janthinobacterium sp. OK676]|nr:hypothetical protein SAMN05216517_101184 [Janthinobacterium sp. OK676]